MTNLYSVLGVANDVDEATLKTTYRRLAMASHPDRNADDATAEQRFKDISLAYETLGDREARATYDARLAAIRARKRREVRSVVATVSASFTLTVFWGVFAAMWLLA